MQRITYGMLVYSCRNISYVCHCDTLINNTNPSRFLEYGKSCNRWNSTQCNITNEWTRMKKWICCLPQNYRSKPPWRVMFFGSDEFSLESLKALNENRLSKDPEVPKLVESLDVTVIKPKDPKVCLPVMDYAEKNGLTIFPWPIKISAFQYDVGVLSSFGLLIPERLIYQFPYGIINIHPSLLPRWRGAAPLVHTILNGDTETGISIMEIRPKYFDIGPLLLQVPFKVPENVTVSQLRDDLSVKGAKLLIETLSNLPALEKFEVEQNCEGVTWAHKVTDDMAFIDWNNQTCESIDRQYRALNDRLNLRTYLNNQLIKLLGKRRDVNDEVTEKYIHQRFHCSSSDIEAGFIVFCKKKQVLLVKCKDGWVGFEEVVAKKKVSAEDFASFLNMNHKGAKFSTPLSKLPKRRKVPKQDCEVNVKNAIKNIICTEQI